MSAIQPHPEIPRCLYWVYEPETGWYGYNTELDRLMDILSHEAEPVYLILHPQGDIPSGNPIPHMSRIVKIARDDPMLIKVYVIMDSSWSLAKIFANVINRVVGFGTWVELVGSYDEAVSRVFEAQDHPAR